ncbi:tRNA a64-2 -o-ribosylphosphate transferase [Niveomyces insectorum RCEF 264]|uniref:tRNA a64-2-o-ribosylphosphate transferase n=1 Tax=Niveomyces insectorum RCEF 264 TaxID=1081102 RepID=A0A167TZP4_9HYPO|nr:tRNA a64-2 -o-ribosylphosphate transferase [Niveomyces insectorum RCEF 264]
MPDAATADLIFASDQANHNFARVLGDLRRAHLSIGHRLRSIHHDAAFVAKVAAAYEGYPLVANERCGSWYLPPALSSKAGSAYFKSTDGHTGQWKFSTRRLNLHLLPLLSSSRAEASAGGGGGCILVDSTRRGKPMPDALSKTVPLWCCVLNRVLFGGETDDSGKGKPWHDEDDDEDDDGDDGEGTGGPVHRLYTPPGVVSASEHSQMLGPPPAWRHRHWPRGKPLRPVWVTPDAPWPVVADDLAGRFSVVICCTASRVPGRSSTQGRDSDGDDDYDYIQGAADDTENWAHGLTPALFWQHCAALLATPEAELPDRIASLVQQEKNTAAAPGNSADHPPFRATQITPYLAAGQWMGPLPPPSSTDADSDDDGVCQIVFVRRTTLPDTWVRSPTRLEVGLGKQDKVAGRSLRYALPKICTFVAAYLRGDDANNDNNNDNDDDDNNNNNNKRVRVLCETGRDIAVGTALALLCFCFDEAGLPPPTTGSLHTPPSFSKDTIRVRLGRIMAAMPHANPSRATLQSVNSFLMDYRA